LRREIYGLPQVAERRNRIAQKELKKGSGVQGVHRGILAGFLKEVAKAAANAYPVATGSHGTSGSGEPLQNDNRGPVEMSREIPDKNPSMAELGERNVAQRGGVWCRHWGEEWFPSK